MPSSRNEIQIDPASDYLAGRIVDTREPTTGGATDHGALTGLADDDHTQYALLAGRATGQTLYGGTASGDDLLLESTSHATKGHIALTASEIVCKSPLTFDAQSELTIATGVITVTKSYHTVDTESDASSDDLVTINGGKDGAILVIRPSSSSRTINVLETGNIELLQSCAMGDNTDTLTLIYDSGLTKWVEVTRSTRTANRTLAYFTPLQAEMPSSSAASFNTRNNHPIMDFDDASTESAIFTGFIPQEYNVGSIVVSIYFTATATTGNVRWEVAVEHIGADQDLDSDGFATAIAQTQAIGGTSGVPAVVNITLTNAGADSITAGDFYRLKISRDGANAADTMSGDAQVSLVVIKEAS